MKTVYRLALHRVRQTDKKGALAIDCNKQWCEDCVPSARHCSACELIHNDDLLPAGDVIDILDLQLLRLKSIDEVARPLLPGVVQVRCLQSQGRVAVNICPHSTAVLHNLLIAPGDHTGLMSAVTKQRLPSLSLCLVPH